LKGSRRADAVRCGTKRKSANGPAGNRTGTSLTALPQAPSLRQTLLRAILCGHPANQVAQLRRYRWTPRPALQAPKDSPAESVPTNDRRRLYDDHRIAPIEEPGKQCNADSSRMIHAARFDATLNITRELLRRTRFSARVALDERKNNVTNLRTSEATPTIARANCSMRSSCQSQPAAAGVRDGIAHDSNYCGAQWV
jgi:hypothetical protein